MKSQRKIEANTDLNVDWLLTGKGDMIRSSSISTSALNINETQGDQSPIVNGNANEVNSASGSAASLKKDFASVKTDIDAMKKNIASLEAQLSVKDQQIAEKDTQIKQLLELLSKKQ